MTPEQESELCNRAVDTWPNCDGEEDPQARPRLVSYVTDLLAQARADERERMIASIKTWEVMRFGACEQDGTFREFAGGIDWMDDPLAHKGRWIGGPKDAELLRAFIRAQGQTRPDRRSMFLRNSTCERHSRRFNNAASESTPR